MAILARERKSMIEIYDPVRMILFLNEMKISHPIRERIVGLFDGTYKVPKNLNCWGTALFVDGRLDKPAFVSCHKDIVLSYLKEARVVTGEKECGDLILCQGDPHPEDYLHHAAVYLGRYNGEDLAFDNHGAGTAHSIESLASAMKYCGLPLTTYRFDLRYT